MANDRPQRGRRGERQAAGFRRALPRFRAPGERVWICILTVCAMSGLMSFHVMPDRVSLRIGDRAPADIRAPRSVSYVDTAATLRHQESIASRVAHVYDRDGAAAASASSTVSDVFGRVRTARVPAPGVDRARQLDRLAADVGIVLARDQLNYLLALPAASFGRLQASARRLVDTTMDREIREHTDDLDDARRWYDEKAAQEAVAVADLGVLKAIGFRAIRANLLENTRATARAREQAMRAAAPVVGVIRPGDLVVAQDDVFTQLQLDKCTALGLVRPRISLLVIVSMFVICCVMVTIAAVYIRLARPAVFAEPRLLGLLAGIVVSSVFGLKLFGYLLGIPLSGLQFGYLAVMMVTASAMLIAALLDPSLAVLVSALLSVLSGLILNHELRYAIMTLVGSLVGIYFVRHIRDRAHLLGTTAALAGTNLLMSCALGGILGDTVPEVTTGCVWALVASAFAIPVFWFGVAVLEKPFGILTHVWLLELSSAERPLLRRLCMEAPGTYAHSIMVGNLADAAAEAIGADTLFCRVASYYHDVGKLRRPEFFVENQRGVNPHDELHPSLSALIVGSHVRDGVELAREHRLPAQIINVIESHHGTGLIRYFYHKELTEQGQAPGDPVLEQHFRYDGPRPRTRESGIIMLADTVEAAARCMDRPNVARLSGLIDTLVQDKLSDGQLDDCALTLRDLQDIRSAFVRVLSAMLHGRVDYPDLAALPREMAAQKETRQNAADAGDREELALARVEDPQSRGRGPEGAQPGGTSPR